MLDLTTDKAGDESTVPEVDRFMRLAEAVRGLCDAETADEIVETVRSSARRLCGAAGIAVVLREDDHCHYVAEDSAVSLWTGQRFPVGDCISGWAMIHRQQVVLSNIYADARVPHEAYRPTGIKSLVMTPVGGPAPFAALGAYWLEERRHTAEEVAILQALAQCMAAAFRTIELREGLETRLAESERQREMLEETRRAVSFQARLLDTVDEAVIATDLEGRVVYWNAFAERLYGWTRDEAMGRTVLELKAAPGDAATAEALMRELQAGKSWTGELALRRKDGSTFPALVRDSPVHDDDGALIGIVGVSWDNSELHQIEQRRRLLINELNHRVKNSLAVVQSIAHQTLPTNDGPSAEAREAFHRRLHALAQAHGLVMESGWGPVPVRSLAATALSPFGYGAGRRITLDGPPLIFAPGAAITLSLALHELGTNAVKYGALSTAKGEVELTWRLAGDQVLIEWIETGGPRVVAPTSRGFGTRMIEQGLARELNGSAKLTFAPEGVRLRLEAEADAVILPAEEAAALAASTALD